MMSKEIDYNFCPVCGVEDDIFDGTYDGTVLGDFMGYSSCTFLICNNCGVRYDVRFPEGAKYDSTIRRRYNRRKNL